MTTLLGALLGFMSSMLPELFSYLKDKTDRHHEVQLLSMQLEQQRQGHAERLEVIEAQNDRHATQSLYQTFYTKIKWVDALNGTVRPVLAYAFFALYVWVKVMAIISVGDGFGTHFVTIYHTLWTQEDAAIFAGIISFYFGQRAMRKYRG